MVKRVVLSILLSFAVVSTPFFAIAKTPNDPLLGKLWYLGKIGAYNAWDTTTGSNDIVVAILDTGVDLDHPDLVDNLWTNIDEIPGDGIDNDHNGYIDDVNGWNFIDDNNDPSPHDVVPFEQSAVSHGTLAAGIVGAVGDNIEGTSGIAWDVRIMSLRILNALGSGREDRAVVALDYAVKNGADVINLSFTGRDVGPEFRQAIKRAYDSGVVVVAAVGNDGVTDQANLNITPIYPACLTGVRGEDWVIGVAATDANDEKTSFSNYGRDCTDISAPGIAMFGTQYQNGTNPIFSSAYGGYWEGTSAASPVIAGSVALLLSRFPTLTPTQVKTILQLSVDPVKTKGTLHFAQLGAGRVNIERALSFAPYFATAVIRGETKSPVAFSAGPGQKPEVNFFAPSGEHESSYFVYDESFLGGVNTIVDDFDKDGQPEFAVIPRTNGTAHVRWFEMDGTLRGQFFAFVGNKEGFSLASGDIDADGKNEFVVTPRDSSLGMIQIYTIDGILKQEIKVDLGDGMEVVLGDVDGELGDEIVLAPKSGNAFVKILRGDGSELNSFPVLGTTFGVNLALGDMTDNGRKDIIVGSRAGGSSDVQVLTFQGNLIQAFVFDEGDSEEGVQVAVGDLDGDGTEELITSNSTDASTVHVFSGGQLTTTWNTEQVSGDGVRISAWVF